jgi:hypothetical protein
LETIKGEAEATCRKNPDRNTIHEASTQAHTPSKRLGIRSLSLESL